MRRSNNYLFLIICLFFYTISYSQISNEEVIKQLNGKLCKIALFNIGRSHNTFRNVNRKYKKDLEENVFISLGLDSIGSYGEYTIYAYYEYRIHRSYYYFVTEQSKKGIKYNFVKGFRFDDILRRLKRILKRLSEQGKLSLLCEFQNFHNEDSNKNILFSTTLKTKRENKKRKKDSVGNVPNNHFSK